MTPRHHKNPFTTPLLLYIIYNIHSRMYRKREFLRDILPPVRIQIYNWQPNKHIDKMRCVCLAGTTRYTQQLYYKLQRVYNIYKYLCVFMSTQKPLGTRFIPRTIALPTYLDGFQARVGIFPPWCSAIQYHRTEWKEIKNMTIRLPNPIAIATLPELSLVYGRGTIIYYPEGFS